MTKHYNNIGHGSKRLFKLITSVIGGAMLVGACNSESENSNSQTGYTEPSNAAVTAFKLKADAKILSGLDTVFFSIDLQRGLIFNADSLPKGTRVTDLIPVISYSSSVSSAVITMEDGQKRSGEVDYKRNPNDSIDFTGKVNLTLTTSAGNSQTYALKVNVHKMEPDSLCWGETAASTLPARLPRPLAQRTVRHNNQVYCMIEESDGTYTVSTSPESAAGNWTRNSVSLPFKPKLRTLTSTEDKLWILASDGILYNSEDGNTWQTTGVKWHNIIGNYNNTLMGLRSDNTGYAITSFGGTWSDVPAPDDFPIEDYTNMYSYQSKWMASPICVLGGGITAEGKVSSAIWAFDGTDWAKLSEGKIPASRCATIVPYYSYLRKGSTWIFNEYNTIFLIGGLKADGTFSKQTYISYDNGVNWSVAPQLLQMPSYIPAMWKLDNTVESKPMEESLLPSGWKNMPKPQIPGWYKVATVVDGTQVKWECPYIFLYGGCDEQGGLYNTIWRGVINRLSFTPIL